MSENTYTYTARSATEPGKIATFTLRDGNVSVEFGNALVEQLGEAYQTFREEERIDSLKAWIRPATTGTMQRLTEPIPLVDFDAEIEDRTLQATAWIRAGGLRLAPIMLTWQEVDNVDSAHAFVDQLQNRKDSLRDDISQPAPPDYWISWVVIALLLILAPLYFLRKLRKHEST